MTTLRLATREQETFETAFQQQIAAFRLVRPDVDIEVLTLPVHEHWERYVQDGVMSKGDIDLFLCCTDWLPAAISKGLLVDLEPYLATNPPPDWPSGWHPAMRKLQQFRGGTFGIAWHDGPQVFHYRRDLFEDPREQAAFLRLFGRPLEVPRTWGDFVEVAKFFTRPEDDLWGCCEGALTDGHNNVYDFLIHLWSRGGTLLDDEYEPRFHEPAGIEALQFYRDLFHLHRVCAPECRAMGSVECGDYYAQGHAAMMWNWCGFAAVCELPQYSKIVGRNACTCLPRGDGENGRAVSLNIYWVLSIASGSQNRQAAYDFLRHTASPDMDRITSLSGANGTRLSTWHDPNILRQYPYYEIIESVHGGTLTLPAIPEYPAINEALSQAVHQVVHEGQNVEHALRGAAEEARNILLASGWLR